MVDWDTQRMTELRELVAGMRKDNLVVEKLEEPPMHVAGCDDPKGRFDWYQVANADCEVIGWFHAMKGVEL